MSINLWSIDQKLILHHSCLHFTEHEWGLAHPPFKQVRVIAHFSELHDQIHQVFHFGLVDSQLKQVWNSNLGFDSVIKDLLSESHLTPDGFLMFGSDLLLDVLLEASQHEWLQNEMESLQLMLVQLSLVHGVLLNVLGKPLLELFVVVEQLWHDKVEKSPEFSHGILDRGSW